MSNVTPFPRTCKPKGREQPAAADPPSIGSLCTQTVADPRYRWKIQRLLGRGTRPVAELLAEVGARYGLTAEIDALLDRYGRVSNEALDVTGGHDFWPAPLHLTATATG